MAQFQCSSFGHQICIETPELFVVSTMNLRIQYIDELPIYIYIPDYLHGLGAFLLIFRDSRFFIFSFFFILSFL